MKRGRPNKRSAIQTSILKILESNNIPMTISSLRKLISQQFNEEISWNTIQKYLQELVEVNKIEAMSLPHSKLENKNGLTVYILKK